MATTALGIVLHTLGRSLLRLETGSLTDGELLERFVARRDEAAFEALLHRHGPMVLGACRRLLHNESDAEDAFQATFLVLVRKAGSVWPRGMVGNWLYGVAHTTALKARAMRTKRFATERAAATQIKPDGPAATWDDLEGLLDQELKSLPDKYRAVIVLCDLEGKSLKEAARELGCPPATVGTRLARGRVMLARRLRRQGIALSAGALGVVLSQNAASAALPTTLAASFLRSTALLSAGKLAGTGMISAPVAALTESVLKTMLLAKLKMVPILLAPVLIGLAGLASTQLSEPAESAALAEKAELVQAAGVLLEEPTRYHVPKETAVNEEKEPNRTRDRVEVQHSSVSLPAKKLPPGLANKSARHPGRVAWLKTHGS